MTRHLLRPDRIRTVQKPFSWLPCALHTTGLFAALSCEAKALYAFLCLVADRQGLSFYSDARLQERSGLSQSEVMAGRAELLARELIAFDGPTTQVLSLPAFPLRECSSATEERVRAHDVKPDRREEASPRPADFREVSPTQLKADIDALMQRLSAQRNHGT